MFQATWEFRGPVHETTPWLGAPFAQATNYKPEPTFEGEWRVFPEVQKLFVCLPIGVLRSIHRSALRLGSDIEDVLPSP